MPDLPEIIKRATRLPAAMASDLAVAGGILRCGSCGRELPLGDIAGYLGHGWPKCCGLTMTWVTLKLLAAEGRQVPDGCELVAAVDDRWRLESGRTCRAMVARAKCGAPAVAALNRRTHLRERTMIPARTVDVFWPYCLAHLYSNWIEDGWVMHWVLREKADPDA